MARGRDLLGMQSAMTAAEGGDVPKLDAEPHGLQEMHHCAPNPLWEKRGGVRHIGENIKGELALINFHS